MKSQRGICAVSILFIQWSSRLRVFKDHLAKLFKMWISGPPVLRTWNHTTGVNTWLAFLLSMAGKILMQVDCPVRTLACGHCSCCCCCIGIFSSVLFMCTHQLLTCYLLVVVVIVLHFKSQTGVWDRALARSQETWVQVLLLNNCMTLGQSISLSSIQLT